VACRRGFAAAAAHRCREERKKHPTAHVGTVSGDPTSRQRESVPAAGAREGRACAVGARGSGNGKHAPGAQLPAPARRPRTRSQSRHPWREIHMKAGRREELWSGGRGRLILNPSRLLAFM
jgi:hypothetical protein